MSLILAVDDELDMLDLIKNILKKNNHQVDVYQNPLEIDNSKLSKYDFDMSTLFWTYFYRTLYINFCEFVCNFKIIYLL